MSRAALELTAAASAISHYEERARLLFTREDRYRARGDMPNALICHYWACVMGHAARSEMVNRAPKGLRA